MLRIGIIGVGHLGKIHVNILKELPDYTISGFYDIDKQKAAVFEAESRIKRYVDFEKLIDDSDIIDVVTPTIFHYDYAISAIEKLKHLFIEKPLASTVNEALALAEKAKAKNVKVQVGHVERFNPAFISANSSIKQPMFIEAHRLAQFNPRGTDVSVIHDLMIHDIDIVLSCVKSPVKNIEASGVAIVSDTPDIANARIEFENRCVANLTASRISLKNMRKARFFQRDAYISVDFLKRKTEIVKLKSITGIPDPLAVTVDLGNNKGVKQIYFENPQVEETNAIKTEFELFAKAINDDTDPTVSAYDGYMAVKIANQISDRIKLLAEEIF
ncbi:MAG: Gfo/Idh/MocA family protein [Bacteroidia bacterium]